MEWDRALRNKQKNVSCVLEADGSGVPRRTISTTQESRATSIISFIHIFNYIRLHRNTDYVLSSQRRQVILQTAFIIFNQNFESLKGFLFIGFFLPLEYNFLLYSDKIIKDWLSLQIKWRQKTKSTDMKLSICNTMNYEVNVFTRERCDVIHVQIQESPLRNWWLFSISFSKRCLL